MSDTFGTLMPFLWHLFSVVCVCCFTYALQNVYTYIVMALGHVTGCTNGNTSTVWENTEHCYRKPLVGYTKQQHSFVRWSWLHTLVFSLSLAQIASTFLCSCFWCRFFLLTHTFYYLRETHHLRGYVSIHRKTEMVYPRFGWKLKVLKEDCLVQIQGERYLE